MNFLFSLMGPYFLLIVEKFLPYPYIVEELYKFFLAKSADSTKTAIILGLLFSISESIFYLFNLTYFQNPNLFLSRFLLVTPMHITTILVMQYFTKRGRLWPFGLASGILIHYLFNLMGAGL